MERIIHILASNTLSGAENVAIQLIHMLDKSQCECFYCCPRGSIESVLKDKGISYIPLNRLSYNELKKVVKQYNPTIIHAHDYQASFFSSLMNRKITVFSHIHQNIPFQRSVNHYSLLYLLSSFRFKRIIVVAKAIIEEAFFKNCYKKKTTVQSNPIDFESLSVVDKKPDVIYDLCYLGRLEPEKNPLQFIHLVHLLRSHLPNIKAVMIGDGSLWEDCRDKIKQYALHHQVVMLGFHEQPKIILLQSRILCIPSLREGIPMAALEALALGLPIVCNNVGGLPSIIDEQCGALCIEEVDYVSEITRLLKDVEYWTNKSQGAINRAKSLSNVEQYRKFLSDLYDL